MDKLEIIRKNIQDSVDLKSRLLGDASILEKIDMLASTIVTCYENKGKVLFCGNGGSAADSQHLASELSGRYYYDRPPLYAEALHVNTSYLTAVANDYTFDHIYSRMVQAIGKEGDVIIGLSTSGNSGNVIEALKEGKKRGMITVGFTGHGGGKMTEYSDILISIPSYDTPRIQECHLMIGHAICQIVEMSLFPG